MFVIFKEFGNYRITSKHNYDSQFRNANGVITLHNCNSYDEALNCAIGAGWTKENIINETGE